MFLLYRCRYRGEVRTIDPNITTWYNIPQQRIVFTHLNMSNRTKNFVGLIATLAMVVSVSPLSGDFASATADPAPDRGQLIGWCDDGDIRLAWGSHSNANSNGLLKADQYPNNADRFWDWLPTNMSQRTYVDRNVTPGRTYWYKVKYRPGLSSNIVAVTCPVRTPSPRPRPLPTLTCSPSVQYTQTGQWVTFSAHYAYPYQGQYPHRQLTWRAVGGHPSYGTGSTFGTRFYTNSIEETRRVTVSNGYRTATCSVYVRGEQPVPALTISPTSRTINSGALVTFRATGGTGYYTWSAPDTVPYGATGSFWGLRFTNHTRYTQTHRVTVRSGNQSRTATVWVRPVPYPYPTPTPFPNDTLVCYPPELTAMSGEEVIFRAYGGTGTYTWTSPESRPTSGHGAHFSARFTNYTNRVRSFTVTLTSGWQTRVCHVNIAPASVATPTPTPTPTYTPTPTPTPYVNDRLDLFQSGRNVSGGQVNVSSTVYVKRNDTVQFVLTVKNTSGETVRNVRLLDLLPYGLTYVKGSTRVNGSYASDDLHAVGLNLGTLVPGGTVSVSFSATAEPFAVPDWGTRTLYNTAQVRGDNADLQVSRLPVVLSTAGILGTASTVKTGVGGSIAIASLVALVAAAGYMLYTRTQAFDRRFAFAAAERHRASKDSMNFARLIR